MASAKIHKIIKVACAVLFSVLALETAAVLIFQVPAVQTYAARSISDAVKGKINGEITIGGVSLVFFNRLVLRDVTVCGYGSPAPWGDSDTCFFYNPGDTLGHVGKLTASFSLGDIITGKPKVRRINLERGFFNLMVESFDNASNLNRILNIPVPDPNVVPPVFPDLAADDIRLKDCGFSLSNPYVPDVVEHVPGQMLYNNLKIRDICAHFKNLETVDGEVRCDIVGISAREASGAGIVDMTGHFHLGPRGSGMDDMHLEDLCGTVLEAEHLYFKYSSTKELAEWVDSVVMDVKFRKTEFTFNSLKHFVPSMQTNNLKVVIEGGYAHGPVADINAEYLHLFLPESNTSFSVKARLTGIPDMPNAFLEGKISDVIDSGDISRVVSEWNGAPVPDEIAKIAEDRTIVQNVSFKGPFRNLDVSGELKMDSGVLSHNVTLSLFTPRGVVVNGVVEADSLNIGGIFSNELFGQTDFKLKGEFESGHHTALNLEYLNVGRIGINGYDYRNIYLSGEASETSCRVWLASRDKCFKADFQGDVSIREDNKAGRYSLTGEVPYIDFRSLNLISGSDSSILKNTRVTADLDFNGEDNAVGKIRISNADYCNGRGGITIDTLVVLSTYDNPRFEVRMKSPFADFSYCGEDPLSVAAARIKDIVFDRQFGSLQRGGKDRTVKVTRAGNDTAFLETHNLWKVLNVLSDGYYLADGSNVKMTLSDKDSLKISMESARIAKKGSYLKDLRMILDNPDSTVRLDISSAEFKTGGLCTGNNDLKILATEGVVDLKLTFLDSARNADRPMKFSSNVSFSRDENNFLRTDVGIDGAEIYLENKKWEISPARVHLGHHYFNVEGFRFHNSKESLNIGGTVSESLDDELTVSLNRLNLSLVNEFLTDKISVGGTLTGIMRIKDFYGNSNFVTNIVGSDVSFFDNPLGNLIISSKWDPLLERINLQFISRYQNREPLNISGYYSHKGRELLAKARLNDLSMVYARPFLRDILKIDGGMLSGNVIFKGENGRFSIGSEDTRFVDFAFTPLLTNVPYIVNGGMKFTEDRIDVDDLNIEDRKGRKALLQGYVSHNFLNDLKLDLRLSFKDLECVDIKESSGASVYGTATGSGSVSVTGPVNDILINARVRTEEGTSLHIPVSNSYAASSNEILVFRDYSKTEVDPYDSIMTAGTRVVQERARLRIKADATLYDDALVTIELDKNLGNIVECHGNARVNLDIDPFNSRYDVHGDYRVTSGMARYSFAGLIARDFILNEGGTLNFNGPLSNTYVDVGATYKTKTSVSTLISDTTSVGTRQNVYASVFLKGNLENPTLNFKIDIPDIDPLTKGRVESAFATESKVQKQFMALMLTGSLLTDEQSGITENGNILYSNVSEMFSNHVNNILRTLNVPLDIGLNYQRTNTQNNMFDVNLSYQAFDNRLILNGSVGNGNRYQNWSGNFEAQLKMDKRGKFRFSLFTRAADQYTNFIDNSQRNGFGFSFQDEFSRFKEIFMSRKKKEAQELEQVKKAKEELLLMQKEKDEGKP